MSEPAEKTPGTMPRLDAGVRAAAIVAERGDDARLDRREGRDEEESDDRRDDDGSAPQHGAEAAAGRREPDLADRRAEDEPGAAGQHHRGEARPTAVPEHAETNTATTGPTAR